MLLDELFIWTNAWTILLKLPSESAVYYEILAKTFRNAINYKKGVMTEVIFTEKEYICFIQMSFLKALVVAGCLKDALLWYVVGWQ